MIPSRSSCKPTPAAAEATSVGITAQLATVLLVGDFTHWQQRGIPMQKGKDGIWTATVSLPPGKHSYRFMVDGEWQDDPECTLRVANPYGTQNMVRQVG